MNSTRKQARLAVTLYFLACSTAPFSLLYLSRVLIVPGDARLVGVCVILAGIPYVVTAFTTLALPQLAYLSRYLMVLEFGELALLWLLIPGAKDRPLPLLTEGTAE